MSAADHVSVQFMPVADVEKMVTLPLPAVEKEDAAYLDGLYEGRGIWEGRGYKEHGMLNPIEVEHGRIQEGHHRLILAKRRGDTEVPVVTR